MGLFDQDLSLQHGYQQTYQYMNSANGAREIDPNIWFDIVLTGLHQLVKHARSSDSIAAIGITGQMHTTVFLDQSGNIVRPAILWNDTRTKALVVGLKKQLNIIRESENAKIVSTGSPLVNLIWLKREEPSHFKALQHLLMPVDYIVYRLTGHYSTDYCDASTSSLFDFKQSRWATKICQEFGIDERILPTIHTSSDVIGELKFSLANQLGLPSVVKVVAGTGDNAATALANKTDQEHADAEQRKIPRRLLGKNTVLFFPHLNGEKTLYADPNLRGAFIGIGLETTKDNMYLAVLEGLAFGCRQLYEQMRNCAATNFIRIVGGGAKSTLWLTIFANVFGLPVHKRTVQREAIDGAVMLALIGDGDNVTAQAEDDVVILPDRSLKQAYDVQYQKYLKMATLLISDALRTGDEEVEKMSSLS